MTAVLRSRPVGSLACQKDSYLRTLEAEVVSCERYVPAVTGNKTKPSKSGTQTPNNDLWQVEFTDSVLFPEGTDQIPVNRQFFRLTFV